MQPLTLFASGLAAGLVAGTASCTAVQGALLVGLTGRHAPPPFAALWRFLAGRLAAHLLAGALLGLVGAAVSPPPPVRAALLIAAGVGVLCFAVRLLRRAPAPCAPPASRRAGGAVLLGAATVLLPCGVTLAMGMVAVSSGSALGGAAVMAGFVAGTAPGFALLGVVLRGLSGRRSARLAGTVAVAVGLWSVGSGLSLAGWWPGAAPSAAGSAPVAGPVTVWATGSGYRPALVTLPAGQPVEVVFKVAEAGCTRNVTIAGRDVALPATVRLPPQRPGILRYVCAMGMYAGFVRFTRPK